MTTATATATSQEKLTSLVDVVDFCKEHDLPADVVGAWVWCKFESKPEADLRKLLSAAGFRWHNKRGEWYHNCGVFSRRGRTAPRVTYGSIPVAAIERE